MTAPTKAQRWVLRLDPGSAAMRGAWRAAYRRLELHRAVAAGRDDRIAQFAQFDRPIDRIGRVIGADRGLSL